MERKKNEKQESLYQDRLPEEVLKELTPEVRRQYFLWDEIMKREIQLYPHLILPVVSEIFHKEYPDYKNIVLLSAEYTVSRVHEAGEKLLQAIRSDILMRIARDLYHFECQIEKDGRMVFRMFEYDVSIALTHGKVVQKSGNRLDEFEISFPRSAILYLGNEKNLPEYETCKLCFPDGTSHLYRVPVMGVQGYGLEEIERKHLNILIPFLPIRFRERIKKLSEKSGKDVSENRKAKKVATREALKNELTEFIQRCLSVLEQEKKKGNLSEVIEKDIGEFLWRACGYLLEEDEELYKMIRVELEPAIKLSREIIQELQESNRNLCQEMENAYRRFIDKSVREGKSAEEAAEELATIFALSKEAAREKVRIYGERK